MKSLKLAFLELEQMSNAAVRVASELGHSQFKQAHFSILAKSIREALADFRSAQAGADLNNFFEQPIAVQQTILTQVDCKALVAAAEELRELSIEVADSNASATRMVPGVIWPWARSAYDYDQNLFGVLAGVVRMRAGL